MNKDIQASLINIFEHDLFFIASDFFDFNKFVLNFIFAYSFILYLIK